MFLLFLQKRMVSRKVVFTCGFREFGGFLLISPQYFVIFSEYELFFLYPQHILLYSRNMRSAAAATATAPTAAAAADESPICPPTHPTRTRKNIPVRVSPHSDIYIYIYII